MSLSYTFCLWLGLWTLCFGDAEKRLNNRLEVEDDSEYILGGSLQVRWGPSAGDTLQRTDEAAKGAQDEDH